MARLGSLFKAAATVSGLLIANAGAEYLNLNEVCLSPLAVFLYSHLGVCGVSPNVFLPSVEGWDQGNYAPWTSRPQCLRPVVPSGDHNSTICSFVSKDFSEGRGIAVITTVALAAEMALKPAFAQPDTIKGINDLVNPPWGPPPYDKRVLPGRGFGMIANRTIFRGERIMQETPSFVYDRDIFEQYTDEDRIPLQWHAAYGLPEHTRTELMDLHKQHGGDEIDDIMRTNAFGAYYGDPWVLHNNVLPRISVSLTFQWQESSRDADMPKRFNHDCRPNAHYYFDPDTMTQYVHAVRTINPGEEVLINCKLPRHCLPQGTSH
jgi:hypothetical protein